MDMLLETDRSTAEPGSTEDAILAAARRCFARYGIRKSAVEDIAGEAGLSRTTIYKHFSGKQEIVDRISLAEMDKVHEALRARMRPQTSFADTVTEAVLVSVQVANENPYARRFVQELELSARSHAPSSPFQIGARERWHSLLTRAAGSGELASDIDFDRIVSWLSLSQMMLLATIEQLGIDEAQLRQFIRRFVVEPLLATRGQPVP
ncbi:TetR/AcrR family transcriptional regulator [Sphingomonas sp. CGMCC 1.13654]|uniref:TetR/AcrR family transcriptional regulator n=1 Tax=Sphingomonas chungangi TaxID=2683589 RepID=A0A838L4D8_9SPHN|nr:TetR/AcrR family transcriptional regulator [Sphingomonas chungangi]MBA2933770.1 TetR/AcrR family transcriptional regulator [Sphingomonas chungangi]MVW55101.1 TetR family transcriptional regulator [Sphingomonas chungangi]